MCIAVTRVMAQEGSAAEDRAALLAFKAAGDPDGDLTSWEEATEPCAAEGWNSDNLGWSGVQCDEEGGRVTRLNLYRLGFTKDGLLGSVESLVPLTSLNYLNLYRCTSVSGSVEPLAALTQLTSLRLSSTLVYGSAYDIRSNISGLAGWGSSSSDFTACSSYTNCPVDSTLVVNATDFVGTDTCSCCEPPTNN